MRVVGDTASVREKLIKKRKDRWILINLPPVELPFSVIVLCLANLNCAFYISCHTRGTLCCKSSSQVSKRLLPLSNVVGN